MVVVLCESPEFLLSVRTLATLITRRLQRIWSFSNVGRTHFGVWSEGISYSGGGMRFTGNRGKRGELHLQVVTING
ncbi:hypothetical protein Bca101_087747 [Brassica carinata]